MKEEKYAVLADVGYYGGDVQHPQGWSLSVAAVSDGDSDAIECIGTLDECKNWLEQLNDEPTYLSHGQASQSYRMACIVEEDTDYQHWLDTYVDWDGCPSEDGSDYDANVAWAEQQAYDNDGILPVHGAGYYPILVDLSCGED